MVHRPETTPGPRGWMGDGAVFELGSSAAGAFRSVLFHTVRISIMPRKPEECPDRRDFMIASIATIGASAALLVN